MIKSNRATTWIALPNLTLNKHHLQGDVAPSIIIFSDYKYNSKSEKTILGGIIVRFKNVLFNMPKICIFLN
jgi:hypothetical protein